MTEEEKKNYLIILVQQELHMILKAYEEITTDIKEREKIQTKAIINYINDLDEEYKNIPNRDEIIAHTIKKQFETEGISISWAEKKLEEINSKRKIEKRQQDAQKNERKDDGREI